MPTTLGKYKLIRELGRGGFGTVYLARDTILDVERAVKVLNPALVAAPEFIERFRREGRLAARLDHPHIVPVYELGETQGVYYLSMKYMPGGSLKDWLAKSGRLPFEQAVEIVRQVAAALAYAHDQPEKLIHRDLKPGNILFERLPGDSAGLFIRLSDFGFAKALASADSGSLSASGELLGTPAYIAPEIWDDQAASPASDQYSLACVLYEILMGKTLFSGSTPMALMKNVAAGPKFPEEWHSGIPAGVRIVLQRALAAGPTARYPSVNVFSSACAILLTQIQQAEQERKSQLEAAKATQERAALEARENARKAAEEQAVREKAQRAAEEQAARERAQREAQAAWEKSQKAAQDARKAAQDVLQESQEKSRRQDPGQSSSRSTPARAGSFIFEDDDEAADTNKKPASSPAAQNPQGLSLTPMADITSVFQKYRQGVGKFTSTDIWNVLDRLLKEKKSGWNGASFSMWPWGGKAAIPSNAKTLEILSVANRIIIKVVLRMQVEERYRVKKQEKPTSKISTQRIFEKMKSVTPFPEVKIDEPATTSFIEKDTYKQAKCAKCSGTGLKESGEACPDCDNGFMDEYTLYCRNVYPKDASLFQIDVKGAVVPANFNFPKNGWANLWQTTQKSPFNSLPFSAPELQASLAVINQNLVKQIDDTLAQARGKKLDSPFEYKDSWMDAVGVTLQRLSLTEGAGSPVVDQVTVNQYKCFVQAISVYQVNYRRNYFHTTGIFDKKVRQCALRGDFYFLEDAGGLAPYHHVEEVDKWIDK